MNLAELSWQELVARLQAAPADAGAWQELYTRLEMLARRVVRQPGAGIDGAEDLAQQALAKLLERARLNQVDATRAPEAYFQTVLRNAARDQARRRVLALKALGHFARDHPDLFRSPQVPDERVVGVLAAVAALPPDQRELIHWRFWDGLPLAEMAVRRGKSYSAVAVELFRILERLREQLKP